MLKKIFIDTETTGSDRIKSGVWQIGGIIDCGRRKEEFLFECDIFEQDEFDKSVTEITGITIEKLTKMADPGKTYDQFVELLGKYVDKFDKTDKFVAIGYGASFDQDVLRVWFEKNDDDYFGSWFWNPWLDMLQAAALDILVAGERSVLKNFKLETVATYLGIKVDPTQQHNALYDANLAMELYRILVEKK